uniref:S-adenosylmethionine:tRNA ribosyltransferase-isomerase n=1 Tax=candidate division WOR-3 bacterium TaxID=2052148 RepID=A0A7C4YBZ8_UNCW3
MRIEDFDFYLPPELIAQYPNERGKSRLLVLNKKTGEIEHKQFSDIIEYLSFGDVLVLNNTKVIPARLFGRRESGGVVEVFILERKEGNLYEVLSKPGRKARPGEKITFDKNFYCIIRDINKEFGTRIAEFFCNGDVDDFIEKYGEIPLPPYIRRKPEDIDKERYQTIYAKVKGAVAAPTAGLHFTEEILNEIKNKGSKITFITLHSGLGTFRPVKVREIEKHRMEPEYFSVSRETAEIINDAKKEGKNIFCVGTTTIRALESVSDENGFVKEFQGKTDLYIYPPYRFKVCDKIITNFHLPKSTLLLLVSAFAGRDKILKAYEEAIRLKYRFFSYGDAMLII